VHRISVSYRWKTTTPRDAFRTFLANRTSTSKDEPWGAVADALRLDFVRGRRKGTYGFLALRPRVLLSGCEESRRPIRANPPEAQFYLLGAEFGRQASCAPFVHLTAEAPSPLPASTHRGR
jgi:hypothetical protein